MTRVLCWNINNFSTNGFYPAPNARPRSVGDDGDYGVPAAPADANSRKAVLLGVVSAVQPDLVSILEVKPGQRNLPPGGLIVDQAAFELLGDIRGLGFPGAAEFQLVPPLVSGAGGRAEGIAVYYRKDRLQFLGPWGWSGAAGMPVGELPGGASAEYPPPWDGGLPLREVPAGWPNAGRWEDELAGQCAFVNAGNAVDFPEPPHRKPWLTCFRDFSNPANQRLVKLLSFHAPPGVNSVEGVDALADVREITPEPTAPNEVLCVIGDFNVSSLDHVAAEEAYGALELAEFTLRLDPLPAGAHNVLPERAYYVTMLKRYQLTTPWVSDDHGAKVFGYPGFDYMGDDAIDNALTHHGAAAGAPANMTVVNPVTHSPYNVSPPPGANPPGAIPAPSAMQEPNVFRYAPPAHNGIDGWDPGADNRTNEFQDWENYTHIRSCSDHLPIALDI